MQTDLWIILGEKAGAVAIVGSFNVEFDYMPGLEAILERDRQSDVQWDQFYAIRISPERAVSLQAVETTPRLGVMIGEIGRFRGD